MTVQNRQIEPKEMAPTILNFGFRVCFALIQTAREQNNRST